MTSRTVADFVVAVVEDTTAQIARAAGIDITVRFYTDDAVAPRCVRNGEKSYTLWFPTGSYRRLYMLLALMISPALDHLGLVRYVLSPADRRDVDNEIPEALAPVFAIDKPIDRELEERLISRFAINPHDGDAMVAAVSSAFVFLTFHECTHITGKHFELRQAIQQHPERWLSDLTLGLSRADYMEGFEVLADNIAANLMASVIKGMIVSHQQKTGLDEPVDDRVMLWVALGLIAVVCLFDWKSRSFDAASETDYPHPTVRWVIIQQCIREALGWDTAMAKAWQKESDETVGFANGKIGAATVSAWAESDLPVRSRHPLSQILIDKGAIGQSVRFEYVIRALERGRRVDGILARLEGDSLDLDTGFGDAGLRWEQELERMRVMRHMRDAECAQDPYRRMRAGDLGV